MLSTVLTISYNAYTANVITLIHVCGCVRGIARALQSQETRHFHATVQDDATIISITICVIMISTVNSSITTIQILLY